MKVFKVWEFSSAPNLSNPPQVKLSKKENSAEEYILHSLNYLLLILDF